MAMGKLKILGSIAVKMSKSNQKKIKMHSKRTAKSPAIINTRIFLLCSILFFDDKL